MGRIQTARHDGLIRRLFSIKGGGSLMAESLGDAFPVLLLEGGPVELLKLAGWELGIGGLQATSGVGETNAVQIFNPPNSGKIVIPTTCHVNTGVASVLFVGVTAVALGTASVGRQRDTREGVTARTTAIIRTGVDAVVPVGSARMRTVGNTDFKIADQEGLAVLGPGTGFTIVTVATNVTVNVGFWWRERVAESSELFADE